MEGREGVDGWMDVVGGLREGGGGMLVCDEFFFFFFFCEWGR